MKTVLLCLALLVSAVLPAAAGTARLSLAPVPYDLVLPAEIAAHLATEPMTGPWAEDVVKAGATAATLVIYQPTSGNKAILMGVYFFPAAAYDAAQHTDEPPPFGRVVIRTAGMVLSIAGPQDTVFEPDTADGRNVVRAADLIYAPASYLPAQ